jgi:hypothetical protein
MQQETLPYELHRLQSVHGVVTAEDEVTDAHIPSPNINVLKPTGYGLH